jgi:hypothetical protein
MSTPIRNKYLYSARRETIHDYLLVSTFGLWAMVIGLSPVLAFHMLMTSWEQTVAIPIVVPAKAGTIPTGADCSPMASYSLFSSNIGLGGWVPLSLGRRETAVTRPIFGPTFSRHATQG